MIPCLILLVMVFGISIMKLKKIKDGLVAYCRLALLVFPLSAKCNNLRSGRMSYFTIGLK